MMLVAHLLEAGNEGQGRRLAAPRGAEQHEKRPAASACRRFAGRSVADRGRAAALVRGEVGLRALQLGARVTLRRERRELAWAPRLRGAIARALRRKK